MLQYRVLHTTKTEVADGSNFGPGALTSCFIVADNGYTPGLYSLN